MALIAGTLTLSDFLLARIAEDEAVARAASLGRWEIQRDYEGRPYVAADKQAIIDASGEFCGDLFLDASEEDLAHVIGHDPTRVLAECEAKRRIVTELRAGDPGNRWAKEAWRQAEDDVLHLLALPYADHPDYDKGWKV